MDFGLNSINKFKKIIVSMPAGNIKINLMADWSNANAYAISSLPKLAKHEHLLILHVFVYVQHIDNTPSIRTSVL